MAKLAKEAQIDAKSAERYFEILNDTLIGRYLPAYSRSVRKRQLQHPKFYIFDVGVWRALRRELSLSLEPRTSPYGNAFEHFIVQQVFAMNDYCKSDFQFSFLRTKDGAEADLVIDRPGKKTLFVEIKSSDAVSEISLGSFLSVAEDAGAEAQIWCREAKERKIRGIRILPWQSALEELY